MDLEKDECDRKLERWLSNFREAGLKLTALAVIRRGEATVPEACESIARFTGAIVTVDEDRLATVFAELAESGHLERAGAMYRITPAGKEYMYRMIKQWNRYVDAMDNLWGCYYST